jgi:hypothetical protein
VALAALRNLGGHEGLGLAPDMVEAGLHKCLATRGLQTWGDPDVPELIAAVEEALRAGMQARAGAVKALVEVCKTASKEKARRAARRVSLSLSLSLSPARSLPLARLLAAARSG